MKWAAAFFIAVLFSLFFVHNTLGYVIETVSFENGGEVKVEISKTRSQLETGLMFREGLEEDSGMLFILNSEDHHSFWMKNVNFPLDLIWLDSELFIVDITRDARPCETDPCPTYSPAHPVRYVIEVPEGFASSNNIELHQMVKFKGSARFQ
jgi:uncharacterized membrane protein (UPF0127 family)